MKTLFILHPQHNCKVILLALLLALVVMPTRLWADNQAYARLSNDSTTLTFRYGDDKRDSDYAIDDYNKDEYGFNVPVWCLDESVLYRVTKVVFDASFAAARPTNCSFWFLAMYSLKDIEGMEYLNTSEVTDMSGMFSYCENLTQLDLSHFDTSNVTDMNSMFSYCENLTLLDISHFDTKNVTNMAKMFRSCENLTELNVSSFNTSKVTNMYAMFGMCGELTTLDLSNFNTSEVTDMQGMFNNCSELTRLDLSNFNTSKVTNMYYMFGWCTQLTDLNISSFNTSQVTNMECMFYYCLKLTQLDLSNFNTENVTNMHRMFSDCRSLTKLDVSSFNTANVTNMWLLFYNCQSLPELDLYSFDTSAATNSDTMFGNNFLLEKIYVSDKFKITGSSTEMFDGCSSLPGYNYKNVDGSMANYTTGYLLKKVGTNGDEILGAKGETLTIDNLQLADNKPFVLYEGCKASTASYSREMASTWGTLCLPYAVSVTAEDNNCSFYSQQSVGKNVIRLNTIESGTIAAGTPVLVKKNDGQASINFTVKDADLVTAPVTTEGTDHLVGTFAGEVLNATANSYFIAKDKFYSVSDYSTDGVKVNPFHAYIQAGGNANHAAVLNIVADGSTTSIDVTDTIDALNNANTEYYDINGRRTSGLQKGVNIIKTGNKTRKVIVK